MKVSLNWLNEYVDVPEDIEAFCDKLDLTGTGVEGVEAVGETFENVVTAQVIKKEKHPDSDHMWVCSVDVGERNLGEDGTPEPLQIVCGAQNFNEGDHIVTAMIGAVLPGDFKIKKSKLRGVASCGMNCSERELGLGSDHDGIMILPNDAPIGVPFLEYLDSGDTVLDLEITPNRPDCLSVTGMAREVGAMYQIDYTDPLATDSAAMVVSDTDGCIEDEVSVTIDDPTRCARYTARVVKNVKIGPSPDWMIERLTAIGQRSINNIVDITNYILFLYGQPLHSFDLDKVKGENGKADIVVRAAKDGEILTTLDGVKRTLTSDMTVISTPEKGAIALAGVMGGENTEIDENSVNILLEAATFEAGRTSRTSRNLGLVSESSMRYERGVDDHGIAERSAAACALIQQLAGGEVISSSLNSDAIIDVWPLRSEPVSLKFRIGRFNAFVGAEIPRDFIIDELTRLGCAVVNVSDDVLEVVAPTFRPDLEREIDLYEEVLRLWGMDRIVPTLPASPYRIGHMTDSDKIKAKINMTLRASGMNETMTYSFAGVDDAKTLGLPLADDSLAVELLNPINADQSVMRQSIIPGLLRSLSYNQSHGVENVQLYEIGTVFSAADGKKKPKETFKIAGVLSGSMNDKGWNTDSVEFDFFDGKGILENLARELALPKVRFKELTAEEAPHLQPGRAAEMMSGGAKIGWVGEIHPTAVRAFDAQPAVVAFELDFSAIQKASQQARPYVDVPVYPAIEIDQNFVVSEDVISEKLMQFIKSAGGKMLDDVRLFDVYRDDEKIGSGKKSMAYKLTYRAADRTLTSEEVEKAHAKMVKKVSGSLGAHTREA